MIGTIETVNFSKVLMHLNDSKWFEEFVCVEKQSSDWLCSTNNWFVPTVLASYSSETNDVDKKNVPTKITRRIYLQSKLIWSKDIARCVALSKYLSPSLWNLSNSNFASNFTCLYLYILFSSITIFKKNGHFIV